MCTYAYILYILHYVLNFISHAFAALQDIVASPMSRAKTRRMHLVFQAVHFRLMTMLALKVADHFNPGMIFESING